MERDRKRQNVDVRYIYFGRNTARLMSSSIFKIGSWLDSSFVIVWRLLDDSLRTRNPRGERSSSRRLNNGLSRLFIFSPFSKKSLMFSLSLFFWKFLNTITVGHRIANVKRKISVKRTKHWNRVKQVFFVILI